VAGPVVRAQYLLWPPHTAFLEGVYTEQIVFGPGITCTQVIRHQLLSGQEVTNATADDSQRQGRQNVETHRRLEMHAKKRREKTGIRGRGQWW
jgi:hypothetical protein